MKKFWKKVPAAMLALLLVVSLLPVTAFAADVEVRIPVSVAVEAEAAEDIPADAVYQFRLTALDGAPMPEDGALLSITGEGSGSFSPICFDRVGVYQYTLAMVPGEETRGTYDASVYDVKVTVENDGDGLKSTVAIRKQGGDVNQKFTAASFTVAYSPLMKDVTVRKVWKDSGAKHPSSVRVSLVVDGKTVDTVTLNDRNNWTYTWKNLVEKRDNSWTVQESTIRGRYVPSYKYDREKEIATVTNTYTEDLIQTGQLNWPIPVLCSLGTALIVYGLYFLFKKRDDACG